MPLLVPDMTLTVTDDKGYQYREQIVTVVAAANKPPVANFSATTSALTATFTDAKVQILMEPGGFCALGTSVIRPLAPATNPSRTYAAAGTLQRQFDSH